MAAATSVNGGTLLVQAEITETIYPSELKRVQGGGGRLFRSAPLVEVRVQPTPQQAYELERLRKEGKAYEQDLVAAHDRMSLLFIQMYTRGSDKIINQYLRTTGKRAYRRQHRVAIDTRYEEQIQLLRQIRVYLNDPNWLPTLGSIVRGLRRVLRNAPRTNIPILLYRGIGSAGILGDVNTFTDLGILSTTSKPSSAEAFMGQNMCCFLVISVPVGTPVLALAQTGLTIFREEDEFLLPAHRMFDVRPLIDTKLYGTVPGEFPMRIVTIVQAASSRWFDWVTGTAGDDFLTKPPQHWRFQGVAIRLVDKDVFLLTFQQPTAAGAMDIPWEETEEADVTFLPEEAEEEEASEGEEKEKDLTNVKREAQSLAQLYHYSRRRRRRASRFGLKR